MTINMKIIGGIFLIIGTSLGAAMLALPVSTAASGFWNSALLLLGCWLVMTLGALAILEVSLCLPDNNNMISMAGATLGRMGQAVAWITYLVLLYALISAYIAGGADVVHYLLKLIGIDIPMHLDALIFTVVLGYVVYHDVKSVDHVNRLIMSVKFIALILLFACIMPHVNLSNLQIGHYRYVFSAITVAITSFGYATIIPTLRTYFKGNVKQLKQVILAGSIIPLLCYLTWGFIILGTLSHQELLRIGGSNTPASGLTQAIVHHAQMPVVTVIVRLFTSVCMFTSFLGVSLCLTDFWADGLRLPKQGVHHFSIMALTFVPPLAMVLFKPDLFLLGLSYAGICCMILLVLLPVLMVWSGRYYKHTMQLVPIIPGGRCMLLIIIIAAISVIGLGIQYDFLS